MKKAVCLFIIALILYTGTSSAALSEEAEAEAAAMEQQTIAATGPALSIDTRHVYPGMEKSYSQGYLPTVAGGNADIVLPLLSAAVTDTLTCAVNLGDPANSPFVYRNYEKQFAKISYEFENETVDYYPVEFSLELAKNRVNGHYPVTFTINGKTDGGEAFTQQFTLYVKISDGIDPHSIEPGPPREVIATGPALSIDTRHVYPGMEKSYSQGYLPTVAGGKADIVLPLLSAAVTDTLTCAVNLGDPASSPFVYKNYEKQFNKKSYTFGIKTVTYYPVEFSLELAKNRINGYYPVTLTISGITDGGEAFTQEFTLYVQINDGIDPHAPDPEQEPFPQPRLMVAGYTQDGSYLEAGEKTTVTVTIKNTSSTQTIKNIKLSFSEESGEVLAEGTGTTYCTLIGTGGSYTWNLAVTAMTTAQSRPHPAVINMEYEDSCGQSFSVSDRIILKVRQPVRLEYEEPSLPARVTQGDTPPFSMSLMNLGKSVIYNTLLKFEIPGLASGGSVLVGTILPGESQTGTTNFRVGTEVAGEVSGRLILSYEDEYGERYEEEIPLSTTIEKKIEAAAPANDAATNPTAQLPRWIALAAAGAALLSLIYFLANRWLKEKRAREEDEMRL